jgi:phosphocarrier protein
MSVERVVERSFKVRAELGLHARPAGKFVSLASRFASEITVGRGEEWVSGCSILSILSLAAEHGSTLKIRAEGTDAEQAVSELGSLLETEASA